MESKLTKELKNCISFLKSNPLPQNNNYFISKFEELLKSSKSNELVVGVLGITSSGKSTFINALLGEKLLPEASIPTSGVLVKCQKGEKRKLIVRFLNGDKKVFEGDNITTEVVRSYAEEKENKLNRKKVYDLIFYSPNIKIPENFIIVDTPGFDAYGYEAHEEITLKHLLPIVDIVVFLTSIKAPFNKSSLEILLEMINRHLTEDHRIFFVQTCKDAIQDSHEKGKIIETKEEILEKHKIRQLKSIRENTNINDIPIIQVSSILAEESNNGKSSKEQENLWKQSGFDSIVANLNNYSFQINDLIEKSHFKNLINLTEDIRKSLKKTINLNNKGVKDLKREVERINKVKEDYENTIKDIKSEIKEVDNKINEKSIFLDLSQSFRKELSHIYKEYDWRGNDFMLKKLNNLRKEYELKVKKNWENMFKLLNVKEKNIKVYLDTIGIDIFEIETRKADTIMISFPKLPIKEKRILVDKPGVRNWLKRTRIGKKICGALSGYDEIIEKIPDRNKFRKDVVKYIKDNGAYMEKEVKNWKMDLEDRYIKPIRDKLEKEINGNKELFKHLEQGDLEIENLNSQKEYWDNVYERVINLLPKKTGSPLFSVNDILKWGDILKSLKEHKTPDKEQIWKFLDEKSKKIIEGWEERESLDKKSKQLVINGLNKIIKNRNFYEEKRFKKIKLSEEAKNLLSKGIKKLCESQIQRFNRLLFESIYPQGIAKSPKTIIVNKQEEVDSSVNTKISNKKTTKIIQSISSIRENYLSRTFLNLVFNISQNHPTVLLLGPHDVGKTSLLKVLLHNINADNDQFPSTTENYFIYHNRKHRPGMLGTIKFIDMMIEKRIFDYVSIIDTPGDENLGSNKDYITLFNSVDVIAVFFMLQELGSSLSGFKRAPYIKELNTVKEKILYVGVGANQFIGTTSKNTKLHQLYFESYKYFSEKSGIGKRPFFIFEGYDNRFNVIFKMLKDGSEQKEYSEDSWLREFKTKHGYYDKYINEDILIGVYNKMMNYKIERR